MCYTKNPPKSDDIQCSCMISVTMLIFCSVKKIILSKQHFRNIFSGAH